MIAAIIAALIGNYLTTCFALGLVVALIRIGRHPGLRTSSAASGVLLDAFILYGIGCSQAVSFVMHSVFGNFAAATIGWAQSPFQLELAFSSLGVAIIAFVACRRSSQLRSKAAVVSAIAVFRLGAAGGHLYELVVHDNHAANNSGLLLWMDVITSAFGLAIVVWHARARRSTGQLSRKTADARGAVSRAHRG
ncbi:MAG: DUF6790 family protein [Janthinobacterium lividum]